MWLPQETVHFGNNSIAQSAFESSILKSRQITWALWPQFLHLQCENINAYSDS